HRRHQHGRTSTQFTEPFGEEAAGEVVNEVSLVIESERLDGRPVWPSADVDHRDVPRRKFLFSDTPLESQRYMFGVRLDDELVVSRLLNSLDQQVAQVGLESGVNVDLWLFDGDDLLFRRQSLHDERQNLADPKADITQGHVHGRLTAGVL